MSHSTFVTAEQPGMPIWAAAPPVENCAAKWCAVYTRPRHEKSLSKQLSTRGIEHFLPLYSARRKWRDGSKVCVELPLFPGYLFVRIDRSRRTLVLQCPGAIYIVSGLGTEAAEIPSSQIEWLRTGQRQNRLEPHPLPKIGNRVRINHGPMSGIEGVLQRVKNSCRVVITLELIMQSVAVEVEMDNLELLT